MKKNLLLTTALLAVLTGSSFINAQAINYTGGTAGGGPSGDLNEVAGQYTETIGSVGVANVDLEMIFEIPTISAIAVKPVGGALTTQGPFANALAPTDDTRLVAEYSTASVTTLTTNPTATGADAPAGIQLLGGNGYFLIVGSLYTNADAGATLGWSAGNCQHILGGVSAGSTDLYGNFELTRSSGAGGVEFTNVEIAESGSATILPTESNVTASGGIGLFPFRFELRPVTTNTTTSNPADRLDEFDRSGSYRCTASIQMINP